MENNYLLKMAVLPSIESELNQFSKLVYDVLHEYSGCILSKETVQGLLKLEKDSSLSSKNNETPSCKSTSSGYPTYPLYEGISRTLYDWMISSKCEPYYSTKRSELPNECRKLTEERIMYDFVNEKLNSCLLAGDNWTRKELIVEILENIGLRGILDLLGMKRTVGSVDMLPPSLSVLWESFKRKHKSNAMLSCGARALSKHCHRDCTHQWWGSSTGSESNKNEHANQVLDQILFDATWINIHLLPHDIKVLEVRNKLGYGARWSYDGMSFRGFLEPQMSGGHSVGWRH